MSRPNKLDELSDDIKRDLHYLIYKGHSSRMIKSLLESKWGSKTDIFPVSHVAIQKYKTNHWEEIQEEAKKDPNIYEQTRKELEGMEEVVKASLEDDGTAFSKLKKLEELLNERIEFIREIQDRGLLSPQYETNVSSYSKDLLKVIEALRNYEKESQQTKLEDVLADFIPVLIRNLTNVILRLQKQFYGDSKRLEFVNGLEQEIPNIIGISLKEITGVDPREKGEDLKDYADVQVEDDKEPKRTDDNADDSKKKK